jgi:hypothetical protein
MRMAWTVAFAATALALAVAGCESEDGESGAHSHDAHDSMAGMDGAHGMDGMEPGFESENTTDGGSYFVTIAPPDGAVPFNDFFDLTVAVHSGSDHAELVTDCEVEVTATMPAHGHGMNYEPEVTQGEDGSFVASGMLFHMQGEWVIHVDVTRQGATERAAFAVGCCE